MALSNNGSLGPSGSRVQPGSESIEVWEVRADVPWAGLGASGRKT